MIIYKCFGFVLSIVEFSCHLIFLVYLFKNNCIIGNLIWRPSEANPFVILEQKPLLSSLWNFKPWLSLHIGIEHLIDLFFVLKSLHTYVDEELDWNVNTPYSSCCLPLPNTEAILVSKVSVPYCKQIFETNIYIIFIEKKLTL